MKKLLKVLLTIAGTVLLVCGLALAYSYLHPPQAGPAESSTAQPRREIRHREQLLYDSIAVLNGKLQEQDSLTRVRQAMFTIHRQQITWYQKQLYENTLRNSIVLLHLPAYNSDSITRYFATEFGEK